MNNRPQESSEEIFPLADVEASLVDSGLQQEHSVEELPPERRADLEEARRQAADEGATDEAEWIYFTSPPWTWQQLCGREGWLLFDRERKIQHAFLMTAMN